jgi:hypothetical protein
MFWDKGFAVVAVLYGRNIMVEIVGYILPFHLPG